MAHTLTHIDEHNSTDLETKSVGKGYPVHLNQLQHSLDREIHLHKKSTAKSLIKDLINYKSQNGLDDVAFESVLEVVLTNYIEQEVNFRVNSLLENKLSSIWIMK